MIVDIGEIDDGKVEFWEKYVVKPGIHVDAWRHLDRVPFLVTIGGICFSDLLHESCHLVN